MSIAALDWAFKQPIEKSSLKFVLVALANYAGPNGECYPSIPTLARDTGQDEKTVRRNLRELAKVDYIRDSGRRVGRGKQIPVFILSPYADVLNPPKNGTHNRMGYQKRLRGVPKTAPEGYQKRHPDPAIDPSVEHKKAKNRHQSEERRANGLEHVSAILGNLK